MEAKPASRRGWRLLRRLTASLIVAFLLFELTLRVFLFGHFEVFAGVSARFRRPELYTSSLSGREYWKLTAVLRPEPDTHPQADPRFGWLKPEIDPATLRHSDEPKLRGRRPVLLYGDSFGACFGESTCWQGLLDASGLGAKYCLLNYAVPGYGVDQMYMLLDHTLDLYEALHPIVVVGIMVEDDLDRCYLELREFPKPSFALTDDGLSEHPLETVSRREFVERNPPAIRSYAWRFALVNLGLVPGGKVPKWTGEGGQLRMKSEITRRLVSDIVARLRGTEYFFVLFHGLAAAKTSGPYQWQEPLLYEAFEQCGAPFVSSRRYLLADANRERSPIEDYFILSGVGSWHYNAKGTAAVFRALESGLRKKYEPYRFSLYTKPEPPR